MSQNEPPQQAEGTGTEGGAPGPSFGVELEADSSNSDVDSAYSDLSGSDSTSLGSSIMDYRYENGRRYHAFRDGSYPLPNDEKEQDRLDLLHHIFKLMLGGSLFLAPLKKDPHRVLDFGTGTGIWAIDFADQSPSAEVLGTDLSPIQPTWVPPNCKFLIDDVESEWLYSPTEAFDFIHGRGMAGSIKDWDKLYSEILRNLKPGAYLEMQEYETWIRSDDATLNNCPNVQMWQQKVDEASIMFGKRLNVAGEQKEKMVNAGFEDVTDVIHKLPLGPWPRDPRQKEIGRYELVQMLDAVEPFTLAIFTRALGWSNERAQALMAGVRKEISDRRNHLYVLVHFIYAKRPDGV